MRLASASLPFAIILTGTALLLSACADKADDQQPIDPRLEHGINLYHQKRLQEAEDELRRALRADPEEWRAPFYVGAVQIELQRYQMAIPYLERALLLNPKEPKILNAMGVAYFKLGKLDMAKGYFWASLDLDPTNSNARGLMETMAKLQRRAEQMAAGEEPPPGGG